MQPTMHALCDSVCFSVCANMWGVGGCVCLNSCTHIHIRFCIPFTCQCLITGLEKDYSACNPIQPVIMT